MDQGTEGGGGYGPGGRKEVRLKCLNVAVCQYQILSAQKAQGMGLNRDTQGSLMPI